MLSLWHTRQQRHCLGTDLPGHQRLCSSLLLSSTVHRQQLYATQTHRSSHQNSQLSAPEHFPDHLSTGKGEREKEKQSNTYLLILKTFSLLKVLGKRWLKTGRTELEMRLTQQSAWLAQPCAPSQHCLTQTCRARLSTMPVLQKVEMGTQKFKAIQLHRKFKASLSYVESCLKKGGSRERHLLPIPWDFVDWSCLEWANPQTGKIGGCQMQGTEL